MSQLIQKHAHGLIHQSTEIGSFPTKPVFVWGAKRGYLNGKDRSASEHRGLTELHLGHDGAAGGDERAFSSAHEVTPELLELSNGNRDPG